MQPGCRDCPLSMLHFTPSTLTFSPVRALNCQVATGPYHGVDVASPTPALRLLRSEVWTRKRSPFLGGLGPGSPPAPASPFLSPRDSAPTCNGHVCMTWSGNQHTTAEIVRCVTAPLTHQRIVTILEWRVRHRTNTHLRNLLLLLGAPWVLETTQKNTTLTDTANTQQDETH